MLIFNLNIRGLGGGTKVRYLRRCISMEGVEFMCLQETKTTEVTDARCFSILGDNNIGWIHNGGENEVFSLCGTKTRLSTRAIQWGKVT